MQMIQLRPLLRHLRKTNLLHSHHVGLGPCLHFVYGALACAQQKLAQPMLRTQLILLRCLVYSHQIHERLGSGGRHPYRCQISGSMTARQIQGIPPISLGPIASLDRSRRRHNNLNDHCRLQRR